VQRGHSPRTVVVGLPAALLLAPLLALGTPVAAAATPAALLPPGQVITAAPAVGLTTPVDGRLRGPDFTAVVTGVGWPASVKSRGITRLPGPGRRLVVFTLRLTQPANDVGVLSQGTAAVALVEVDGTQVTVDLTSLDDQIAGTEGDSAGTGTESFCLSVPTHGHDVDLVLTEAGFSQRFDLWTLKRLSPAPTVLYRGPTSSSVTTTTPATALLPTTNPADGYSNPAQLTLKGATLTYFAPDGSGTTPGNPTTAYLVADLTASPNNPPFTSPNWGHFFSTLTTLPGDQLTFTPTGGTPVTATTAPLVTTPGLPTGDDGLFNAQYWFTVPATTTTGTITVPSGTVLGTEYLGFTATQTSVPLDLPTTATLTVTFPAVPSPPPAQKKPPWVGAPLPATGTTVTATAVASATGATGSGDGGFPIWLAVVLVVVLVIGTVLAERLVRRRRQRLATIDTGSATMAAGPPADVSGSQTALAWPPPAPSATAVPTSRDVPGAVPTALPPLGAPGDLVVRVLGPVEVTGWVHPPERRGVLEELCCFLALHPGRGFTTAELLEALWPVGGDRGEATPKTLHNYLSRLRQAVGPEHLPDAVTSGGYRLDDVVTDWAELRRLTAEATSTIGPEADRLRADALGLVRGPPLADAQGVQFGWAFSMSLASTMTVGIGDCARRLSGDRLAAGDPVEAEAAARSGLRATVGDEELWLDAARAAKASGDPARERRLWRDLTAALGPASARALRDRLDRELDH
jgi:hypothetical protein